MPLGDAGVEDHLRAPAHYPLLHPRLEDDCGIVLLSLLVHIVRPPKDLKVDRVSEGGGGRVEGDVVAPDARLVDPPEVEVGHAVVVGGERVALPGGAEHLEGLHVPLVLHGGRRPEVTAEVLLHHKVAGEGELLLLLLQKEIFPLLLRRSHFPVEGDVPGVGGGRGDDVESAGEP